MVSYVKKVSKGSKFVKNVQGIKKGQNSAKGQSTRRVDISTSFSGRGKPYLGLHCAVPDIYFCKK